MSAMRPAFRPLLLACALGACDSDDTASARPDAMVDSLLDAGLDPVTPAAPDNCPELNAACLAMPGPSYSKEVAPLIQRACSQAAGCHTGIGSDPWPLGDYDDLVEWSASVVTDLKACSMPPADAGVSFTLQDRATIGQWLACGAKRN